MTDIVLKNKDGDNVLYEGVENIVFRDKNGDDVVFVEKSIVESESTGKYSIRVVEPDGTIIAQTKANSGFVYTLPTPKEQERLVFREWIATVPIENNTVTVVDDDILISAVYNTKSGLSEFDICLTEETGLEFVLNMSGEKNWGDGTVSTEISHVYSSFGEYTVTCNGSDIYTSEWTSCFTYQQQGMNKSVVNIILSENVSTVPSYAFYGCTSLQFVSFPATITTFSDQIFTMAQVGFVVIPKNIQTVQYMFQNCPSVKEVLLPYGVVNTSSTFSGCYCLENIILPKTIKSFGYFIEGSKTLNKLRFTAEDMNFSAYVTSNCERLFTIDFSSLNYVPVLFDSNAFFNSSAVLKIYVPDDLYDSWISDGGWAVLASKIRPASEMGD